MFVSFDGRLLPEQDAVISIRDRSFLYGDGLFETIPVVRGRPFRWAQHIDRLCRGARFLRFATQPEPDTLHRQALELIARNQMPRSTLRIHLSRGVGPRGDSTQNAANPSLLMTLHPATPASQTPTTWRLVTSTQRVPLGQPLTRYKTANRLPYILARGEADDHDADEALVLNTDGNVAEGSRANLFWIESSTVLTPPLDEGGLDGVTRALVLEICVQLQIPTLERPVTPWRLRDVDGVFLSLSTLSIAEAISLDNHALRRSPLVETLRHAVFSAMEQ